MLNENQYLKLFACCIPVKGQSRSIICDLQRYNFDFIPNDLFDLLDKQASLLPLGKLKDEFGKENEETLESYIQFILENEYGFLCEEHELENFPPLDLQWESPTYITNAIIDFDKDSIHDVATIATQLDKVGCKALELRFYDEASLDQLNAVLEKFSDTRLNVIYLKMKYFKELQMYDLEMLGIQHKRVKEILVHSANEDQTVKSESTFLRCIFTRTEITSELCCGNIHPGNFRINTQLFTESLQFNSCLNKKISVDKNGLVKNCPSSAQSFGNHKEVQFMDLVFDKDFTKKWNITKDQVDVCKVCEFRYICTDCRVFIEDNNNPLSKPIKCNYNPNEAQWTQ